MNSSPTIGRIVHFVLDGEGPNKGQHRAAMVTGGQLGRPNLSVFVDQTEDVRGGAPSVRVFDVPEDDEGREPGTWHWPERDAGDELPLAASRNEAAENEPPETEDEQKS